MKSPRKSINDAGDGNDRRTFDKCSKPWIARAWALGLYGKLALMQDEVRKVRLFAASEYGEGAVTNVPDRSFDKEYMYFLDGWSPLKVMG